MKKSLLGFAIMGFMAASLTSCDSDNKVERKEEKVQDAKEELADAKKDARQDNMDANHDAHVVVTDDYATYRTDAHRRIEENDREIAELKARMAKEKKEVRAKYDKKIADAERRNKEMKVKIDTYDKDGKDSNWDSFKREFNHDMDELGASLKDLVTDNKN